MKKGIGALSVLLGASFYGLTGPIVKFAYEDGYSFEQVTFSQYALAAILLLLLLVIFRGFKRLSGGDFAKILVVGIVGLGGTSLLYYACLGLLSASLGLILLFQFTWIGLLLERLIGRKVSMQQVISAIVILIGTGIALKIMEIGTEDISVLGIVLGLGAALCYSIFLVGLSLIPGTISPLLKSTIMVVGSLVVLFVGFALYTPIGELNPFTGIFKWGIILSLIAQIAAPYLLSYGAPIVGGSASSLLSSMELPVGLLGAYFFLHEKMDASQLLGVALILVGIVFSQLSFRRKTVRENIH